MENFHFYSISKKKKLQYNSLMFSVYCTISSEYYLSEGSIVNFSTPHASTIPLKLFDIWVQRVLVSKETFKKSNQILSHSHRSFGTQLVLNRNRDSWHRSIRCRIGRYCTLLQIKTSCPMSYPLGSLLSNVKINSSNSQICTNMLLYSHD